MKGIEESHERLTEGAALKIWDCGSPLYDSYEVVAVSHLIEKNFMIFPNYNLSGSKELEADNQIFHSSSSSSERSAVAEEAVSSINGGKSSVFSFLKRKKTDGQRKENKAKKQKVCGISKFFACKINPWKK
ncbi:hypothetical protein CDL12_00709 [Handroanthus impetiginosus]|uniref:Uncharacterized protein n=1 Tax=Handroanthus impetiginosus TaxID=429701 RepID=A0A2G9I9W5_9LAMI|nr:hypothetical protein CDL12_00709 [Handroanthus impetiginosus]